MGSRNTTWRDLSSEQRLFSCRERYSVPLFERMKQLWAFGYARDHIYAILKEEFEDLEVNPITPSGIDEIIEKEYKTLNDSKNEMALICREDIISAWKENFQLVASSENKMTRKLVSKMDQIGDALEKIDLSIIDDKTGRPMHLNAFMDTLDAADKLQKLLGKIAGTDSFRDLEVYKLKATFDQELKNQGGGLITLSNTPDGKPTVTG